MSRFGTHMIVRPLSSEKLYAEIRSQMVNDINRVYDQVSTSVKASEEALLVAECIKAVKELKAGNSDYSVIEFYTDKNGISRMNIAHVKARIPKK